MNADFDLGLENGGERFVKELKQRSIEVTYFKISKTTHGSITRTAETVEKALTWINEHLNFKT